MSALNEDEGPCSERGGASDASGNARGPATGAGVGRVGEAVVSCQQWPNSDIPSPAYMHLS